MRAADQLEVRYCVYKPAPSSPDAAREVIEYIRNSVCSFCSFRTDTDTGVLGWVMGHSPDSRPSLGSSDL